MEPKNDTDDGGKPRAVKAAQKCCIKEQKAEKDGKRSGVKEGKS